MNEKTMPHNIEAEQSVLGAMFLSKYALQKSIENLSPEVFYKEAHAKIFNVMTSLAEAGSAIDITTVIAELDKRKELKQVGRQVAEEALEENLRIKELEKVKEKMEKDKFVFKVQTGKQDMMFGQISSKQIKKSLDEKGYSVNKTQIKMDHPITGLGTHEVVIELHKKVVATIKVKVEKES